MRKKALFVLHASQSHVNASRRLLDRLTIQGVAVTVCANPIGRACLENLPYRKIFIDSMPFASGFESFTELNSDRGRYHDDLLLRKSGHFYRHRRHAFTHICTEIQPDIILIDILYATDAVLLYDWCRLNKCKLFLVRTKVNPWYDLATPPMNVFYTGNSRWNNRLLWYLHGIKKAVKDQWHFVKYQGFDDRSILFQSLREQASLLRRSLLWYRGVGVGFRKIPEIVFLPTAFEMPGFQSGPDIHYVGFQYESPKGESIQNNQLQRLLEQIRNTGQILVYVSFGTVYKYQQKRIKTLLDKLKAAIPADAGMQFVISLRDATSFGPTPLHFHFFDRVDQPAVLRQVDLFITHGGINSIKDALYAEVPMLVYPLNLRWDQPGNSARVKRLGLGLRGRIGRESPRNIHRKIQQLLEDPSFVDRIQTFKRSIDWGRGDEKELRKVVRMLIDEPQEEQISVQTNSIGYS